MRISVMIREKEKIVRIKHFSSCCLDKGVKGTVVNWTCHFINEMGENTFTVP